MKTARETETKVRYGFVASGGEQIYFEDAGNGDAVVLCHGFGGNHAIWYQQVPILAERNRVVTWDQRGFGRSTNRTRKPGPASAIQDLRALLAHLDIERAHVIGQSMGGWAALGFTLEEPERVRSLVLACTIGGIYTPELRAHFDTVLASMPADDGEEFEMTRHPALGELLGEQEPERALLYHELGALAGPPPPEIPGLLSGTSVPLDALVKLSMPVLFIVGGKDPVFPPDLVRGAAALVPHARLSEIHQTGHSPYFEDAVAWNEIVLSFLRDGS